MFKFLENATNRRWIYGIILCAAPLLVMYGIITEETQGAWTNLAAAILGVTGVSLALPNTPSQAEIENKKVEVLEEEAVREDLEEELNFEKAELVNKELGE